MRALIADDAAPLRALLRRALGAHGCEVAGEATDAESALALARDLRPDVVVLDGRLPPDGALAILGPLLAAAPGAAVFVVASLDERNLVRDAIAAGARGAFERPLRAARIGEALAAL